MDQEKSALYKYTQLVSLRKIDAEFWNCLSTQLQTGKRYENVNLKNIVKLQKALNNAMMKMISETAVESKPPMDSVDEVEGFVLTQSA